MSTVQKLLDLDLRKILNPKIWLLVVLISHTLLATLIPLFKSEFDSIEFQAASYGLLISVVLASIYFMTDGKEQARLTALIAGSTFLWIIISLISNPSNNFDLTAKMEPPFLYKFSFDIELAPPILFWALLSLSGFVYWNVEEENLEKSVE